MTNFGSSWALGALSKISTMPANMRPSEPSANGIAYFRAGANMVPRRGTIRQAHRLPVPISRGPLALVDCLRCKVEKGRRSIGGFLDRLKRTDDPRASTVVAFMASL